MSQQPTPATPSFTAAPPPSGRNVSMTGVASSKRFSMAQSNRRKSSVADVFGVAKSTPNQLHLIQTQRSFIRVTDSKLPPMFAFKQHESLRTAARSHLRSNNDGASFSMGNAGGGASLAASPSQHDTIEENRRKDREERRNQVNEALGVHLGHLVVESRKDKLVLPSDDDRSVTEEHDDFCGDDDGTDIDELWKRVAAANRFAKSKLKSKNSELQDRINPRWWRHLCLRDFSEFLSPGLFCTEELLLSSESENDDDLGADQRRGASSDVHDSLVVMSATTHSNDDATSLRVDASRAVKHLVVHQQLPPLHLDHQFVSAWTQHVTTRHAAHWLTPRRHNMHSGKSVAEIGTLTTVSMKDFVVMANSLMGICQTVERVSRLELEREEQCELAALYQLRIFQERPSNPFVDVTLRLTVAESEEREDIVDDEKLALEWLIALHVVAPYQIAAAEREKERAVFTYLSIANEVSGLEEFHSVEEIDKLL